MRIGCWYVYYKDQAPKGGQLKCNSVADLITTIETCLLVDYEYVEFFIASLNGQASYGYKYSGSDWQIMQLEKMKNGGFITSQISDPKELSFRGSSQSGSSVESA